MTLQEKINLGLVRKKITQLASLSVELINGTVEIRPFQRRPNREVFTNVFLTKHWKTGMYLCVFQNTLSFAEEALISSDK